MRFCVIVAYLLISSSDFHIFQVMLILTAVGIFLFSPGPGCPLLTFSMLVR